MYIDLDFYLTRQEQEQHREYLYFMTKNNFFDLLYYLKNKNKYFKNAEI